MKWECDLKRKKVYLLVLLVSFVHVAGAQIIENNGFGDWTSTLGTTQTPLVTVSGAANYGSSAIDNVFAGKIAFGGHIESDRISDIYDRMDGSGNSARVDLSYSAMYFAADSLHKRSWNMYGGFTRRYYGQASFNKDVFGLIFKGNKAFAGSTMDFTETQVMIMEYAKYSIGGYKRVSPNSNNGSYMMYGGALSYLQGIDYLNFSTNEGSLFTEQSGEYVDLTLQYNTKRSSRPKGLFKTKGSGVGIDLFFAQDKGEKYYYSVAVSDFGFIKFKDLNTYNKDTTDARFEGHRVFRNGGSLSEVLDSIVDVVVAPNVEADETVFTPMVLSFRIGKHLREDLDVDILIQHVFTENNLPFVKTRLTKSKGDISYGVSLGLLAMEKGVIIGLHGRKKWRDKILLQADVAGLESYLAPSILQGLQVNVGLGVLLN